MITNNNTKENITDSEMRIPEISIVLPCLNEEQSVIVCLERIKSVIQKNKLNAEVLLVDNASDDTSFARAEKFQKSFNELTILTEPERGYGSAYLKGLSFARGTYIFMADVDGTYDFKAIPSFIHKLKEGFDLVLGNRFSGNIAPSAMPWLHRHIGNPFLSLLVKIFFKVAIHDIHCGMRAVKKDALKKIVLYTSGMEFASEMVIKAAKRGLSITELPIAYNRRIGKSKLQSFSDGWRHLRFILLYSPLYLFLMPGIILFLLGVIFTALFYITDPIIFGIKFYFHPMFLSALMTIVGYQFIFFAGFAKIYAITHLGDSERWFERLFKHITIERAGIAGIFIAAIGLIIYFSIFAGWISSRFGSLNEIKNSIAALTLIVLGIQTVSSAFMLSILGIKEK